MRDMVILNKMELLLVFSATMFAVMTAFQQRSSNQVFSRHDMTMKWTFGKGSGSLQDIGAVGQEGEYYFHPNKVAKLKAPEGSGAFSQKSRIIPIFPYTNVLVPLASDWLNILEMRHRQLLGDVGDGLFGFCYYSQTQQKLGLVGTLARIKGRKILEDGRSVVVIEGVERFYLEEIISEKPYIKARVQPFKDYSENADVLDQLEQAVFDEVRTNVQLMRLLYPEKNYTISANILEYRPPSRVADVRSIRMTDESTELDRKSKFSFAIMEMLQITPATKLMFLQEHVIEKRYARFLKLLEKGGLYLRDQLKIRDSVSDEGMIKLKSDILLDTSDLEIPSVSASSWQPENYVDGQWIQKPTLM